MVLWRVDLELKSGVSERRCDVAIVLVNGLVLLGPSLTSDIKGFEETGSVSCERLREGGGGASKDGVGSRLSVGLDWGNRGTGVEFREREVLDEWKELCREEVIDRDWLFNQELEGNRSELSGSKVPIFNCASFRIPFVPFA